MGARQGIGAGKGTVAQQGCLGVQGDLTLPSPAPWKLGSTPEGFVFPLHAHFGLDSLVSLPAARRSHQWPRGSPQLSFTLPVKVSQ